MKTYAIVYDPSAVMDMAELQSWLGQQAGERIARDYLQRIRLFCRQLRHYPRRGEQRDDIRSGIRLISFQGRVEIAFEVEADRVVIIRVLYAGRQFDSR